MNEISAFIVDAFSSSPFAGNPAAVCLLSDPVNDTQMQNIAAEFNLSETAFCISDGEQHSLRWFTPVAEVDLCGHATLATARVLFSRGWDGPVDFHTKSGTLQVWKEQDRIGMRFPLWQPEAQTVSPDLCQALHLREILSQAVYHGREDILLVRVSDAQTVYELQPDMSLLKHIPAQGIIVTALSDKKDVDFVCRFFAPRIGIPEDPVTGAVHCILAPFWANVLSTQVLTSYQASARGGRVYMRLEDAHVILEGEAVIVLEGTLKTITDYKLYSFDKK